MTVADIRFLYEYTAWANERMFDVIVALSPGQQTQQVGGSFGSIRETVAHTVAADWVWLSRWIGESPRGWPTWSQASVAEIREEWRRLHTQRLEFINGLRDEDLTVEIEFARLNGEVDRARLGFLMQHVVNHATYHRGQLATQIRQVGGVPPSTDLLRYRP